ncbi:PIHD2 protein, partial [Scytalopus superciliaris]|nr:PIHD2 protein [Scytalopus superciliaris]
MEQLIHLTLRFLEEQCDLPVSRSYTIEPFQLKGSLGMMQQRLRGAQPEPQPGQDTEGINMCVENLFPLQELPQAPGAEGCSNPGLLRTHLIEEISSSEVPERPSTPVYKMITVRDANKKPLQVKLRAELPQVTSASECDLSISKDDIIIEVPEKYKLQLDLPKLVDEETTTAVFNKAKRVLFVSAPVAKPDP